MNTALASHQLVADNPDVRLDAARQLQKTAKPAQRELLAQRTGAETDDKVKAALQLALANLQLADADPQVRLAAVRLLGDSGDPLALSRLQNLLDPAVEADQQVRTAAATNAYRHSPTEIPSRGHERRLTARYANPDRTRRSNLGGSEIQSGACGNACRQLRSRERVILFAA